MFNPQYLTKMLLVKITVLTNVQIKNSYVFHFQKNREVFIQSIYVCKLLIRHKKNTLVTYSTCIKRKLNV